MLIDLFHNKHENIICAKKSLIEKNYKHFMSTNKFWSIKKIFILKFYFNFKIFYIFLVKLLYIVLVGQYKNTNMFNEKNSKVDQHPSKFIDFLVVMFKL